jgi:hypothetical protein
MHTPPWLAYAMTIPIKSLVSDWVGLRLWPAIRLSIASDAIFIAPMNTMVADLGRSSVRSRE